MFTLSKRGPISLQSNCGATANVPKQGPFTPPLKLSSMLIRRRLHQLGSYPTRVRIVIPLKLLSYPMIFNHISARVIIEENDKKIKKIVFIFNYHNTDLKEHKRLPFIRWASAASLLEKSGAGSTVIRRRPVLVGFGRKETH